MQLGKINTKNPYKKEKKKEEDKNGKNKYVKKMDHVIYFEDPKKTKEKINKFRR